MANFGMGPNTQEPFKLKPAWAGFDLVQVGSQVPMTYRRGDLFILSGCITTTTPIRTCQAGWDLPIGKVEPRCAPPARVPFLAPTSMSRYEGIYQAGTSAALMPDRNLSINFGKSTNPMVLHLSGFCCVLSNEEPTPIPVAEYAVREWITQLAKPRNNDPGAEEPSRAVEPDEQNPPALHRCGNIVCLRGELKEATFGPVSQQVGTLPEGLRPKRELRWLACLLSTENPGLIEHSVALTLRPNGTISVQGGKVHTVDQKGNMRVLQQKKKGRLCLDGIRFSLVDGEKIELSPHVGGPRGGRGLAAKGKMGYLMTDAEQGRTAVCIRQGDVVLLEGHLVWTSAKPPNARQPLATLPKDCWPHRRETFFTRGGSDLEERRRVDIDRYGRVFCPEGAADGRVELTGVIFVAAEPMGLQPRDPDWDELKLQYHRSEVNVVSASFDGHELLEQFVRRSNYHEWRFIEYDFGRHASRKMLLPLGQVPLRGQEKWDSMNLGNNQQQRKIWQDYKGKLAEKYGITAFHTLLHLSDSMFDKVTTNIQLGEHDYRYLTGLRQKLQYEWNSKRQPGLTPSVLQELATSIVGQMFEHWDFKAQLQGALQNDFRAPATIEHLFPQRKSTQDMFVKKRLRTDEEMARFEEARQFFFLYETTGCNMTHCSLMGTSDIFTTTGKWHFPDAPDVQKQLFEHIAWLFPKNIYLFMSERQTPRFPFIEDLDIQCRPDWIEVPPGEKPRPPDELIMERPKKDANGKVYGEPGELMRHRARAVHMIYPHLDHLDVLVYSASGYNKGKDMLKSSFHLVWPQLIVDSDRAPVIRHVTLGLFQKETMRPGSVLGSLQTRLLELHKSNNWELVFDSTTINARNGLRLPYSDKASMVIENEEDKRRVAEGSLSKTKAFKKRVREDRPSKAVGRIRFEFDKDPETGNDVISSAQWDADADTYSIAQWILMGSCRRDPNAAIQFALTSWQIGPDVLAMLPTKPGEQFYFEGEADGEGGHWVTHKPFPQIRRCTMTTHEFKKKFNEALGDEWDTLEEERNETLQKRLIGTWISVTEQQAIWRTTATSLCQATVPDRIWGAGTGQLQRPAEVFFLKAKGKVVVDGLREVTEALLRVLRMFTKPDDNAVMPIYDVNKIS
mmetsp:Transcript_85870/g.243516  ORF Transcript_85870/g.243516 Transcript_85870/m.243516 type:complete len:1128 (-) Transcript_85870:541-3924(-)